MTFGQYFFRAALTLYSLPSLEREESISSPCLSLFCAGGGICVGLRRGRLVQFEYYRDVIYDNHSENKTVYPVKHAAVPRENIAGIFGAGIPLK